METLLHCKVPDAVMESGKGHLNGIMSSFMAHAARLPDKQAIWCEGRIASYQELSRLVCQWSNAMMARHVKRGDHIGVLLPNSIEFVALILAAADLGAVLVPLNTSLMPPAVHRAFDVANVKHVIATASLLSSLRRSGSPRPEFSGVDGLWLSVDEEIEGAVSLTQLLQEVPPDVGPVSAGHEDDALILTMTSGSTGDPKPIILTQRTKFNRAMAAVEMYGVTELDRTLAATPLYHSLAERLVLIPLLTGGTSILMSGFSASTWLQRVREHAVTFTIAVSSQLKQISGKLGDGRDGGVASLRCLVSSSALLDHQVKSELLSRIDCDFHECYGTSEIAIASNLDAAAARNKLQSVGIAAIGVDIKIIGKNDEVLPNGEAGEIVCRTPMLFGGYFNAPEKTKAAMWGDYFRTGDTGRLDDDGFLYFLGRTKDIIISGGINVYPGDIEEATNAHQSVAESAAFPFPDERLGEIVAIAVVPTDKETFDLRQLRFHCCERLADYQQPRKFFVVDELPKNGMGKLMKFELVRQFATETPQ